MSDQFNIVGSKIINLNLWIKLCLYMLYAHGGVWHCGTVFRVPFVVRVRHVTHKAHTKIILERDSTNEYCQKTL